MVHRPPSWKLHFNSFHVYFLSFDSFKISLTFIYIFIHLQIKSGRGTTKKRAAAGGGRTGGGSTNILQFYNDESPGLQVGPTTVLIASLSFVGIVVLLHIWGKFRM